MERGALSTAEFREFGKKYVLFCHITSHIEGEKYGDLLSKKGGTGFPYVVAMDQDGNVIAKHSGARTVEGFRATIQKGEEFQALMAKEELTPEEAYDLFMKRLNLRHFDLEQAREEAAKLEFTEEQQARVDSALLGMEIQSHAPTSRDGVPAAGKAYAEMYRAGREPTGGRDLEIFFVCILEHAYQTGDAALFEDALGKLRGAFGDNPRAAGFFTKQDARLAELKAKADTNDE